MADRLAQCVEKKVTFHQATLTLHEGSSRRASRGLRVVYARHSIKLEFIQLCVVEAVGPARRGAVEGYISHSPGSSALLYVIM